MTERCGAAAERSSNKQLGSTAIRLFKVTKQRVIPTRSPFIFFFDLPHQPFHFTLAPEHPVDLFLLQLA